eukprot:CAMPEP_0197021346 /NCGR_PEP_ID=MMETSP1384-20130603/2214_1 /TAXON_ID=29189 /ORGANISM="Ammonia sp." /LENGTH=363 /DNA_ID=CAMNT_0042449153 /DNA_START=28 /DNA_END=1119 /DNA_ORIENTATION=+
MAPSLYTCLFLAAISVVLSDARRYKTRSTALLDRIARLKENLWADQLKVEELRSRATSNGYSALRDFANVYDLDLDEDTLDDAKPDLKGDDKAKTASIIEHTKKHGWTRWEKDHILHDYKMLTLFHFTTTENAAAITKGCKAKNGGDSAAAFPCQGGFNLPRFPSALGKGIYFAIDPVSAYAKTPKGFLERGISDDDKGSVAVCRVMVGKELKFTLQPPPRYSKPAASIKLNKDVTAAIKSQRGLDAKVMDALGYDSLYVGWDTAYHYYTMVQSRGPEYVVYHADQVKIMDFIEVNKEDFPMETEMWRDRYPDDWRGKGKAACVREEDVEESTVELYTSFVKKYFSKWQKALLAPDAQCKWPK